MPSDLQVSNIKDQANANSAISIASDGQITVNQNNPTLTLGSNATGFTGVKNVDMYRLNANITGGMSIPYDKLTRGTDAFGCANLGTGMTLHNVSNVGVFTFPATGIWRVEAGFSHIHDGVTRYHFSGILLSTGGKSGSFNLKGNGRTFMNDSNASSGVIYSSAYVNCIFDVSTAGDTGSSYAVKFDVSGESGSTETVGGGTNQIFTWFLFTRLGDT